MINLEITTAAKTEVKIPIIRVVAKDSIGPEPNTFNTIAVRSVVTLASMIEDNALENNITIYPNPSSDIIYIDGINSQTEIELFDLTGQLILQQNYINGINISDLNRGIYILKLNNKNLKKWQKDKFCSLFLAVLEVNIQSICHNLFHLQQQYLNSLQLERPK